MLALLGLLASFGSLARALSLWNIFEPIFLAKTALLDWYFEVEYDKLKTVLQIRILKYSWQIPNFTKVVTSRKL